MRFEEFEKQLLRLVEQWGSKSYSDARLKILWRTFQNEQNEIFQEAIDWMLVNCRVTPLVKEFHDAVEAVRANRAQLKKEYANMRDSSDMGGILEQAALNSPNMEFAQQCLKVLRDYWDRRITKQQFDEACGMLDHTAKIITTQRMATSHAMRF